MIESYENIEAFGKRGVYELFNKPFFLQEKIDGSQISFGVYNNDLEISSGGLKIRSRSQAVDLNSAGMFASAVDSIKKIQERLIPNWTYRGEFLRGPKHNVLTYGRAPIGNIVLFDIQLGDGTYTSQTNVRLEALGLGLDYAPVLAVLAPGGDLIHTVKDILANSQSVLGGPIEGVVAKRSDYSFQDGFGNHIFVKFVSDQFKEKAKRPIGKSLEAKSGLVEELLETYAVDARFQKSVQHLQEAGKLHHDKKDLPNLIKESWEDLQVDYGSEIHDRIILQVNREFRTRLTQKLVCWYTSKLEQEATAQLG